MRNIANVVHDLKPEIQALHDKMTELNELDRELNSGQFFDSLRSISHRISKLENYMKALEKDIVQQGLMKENC